MEAKSAAASVSQQLGDQVMLVTRGARRIASILAVYALAPHAAWAQSQIQTQRMQQKQPVQQAPAVLTTARVQPRIDMPNPEEMLGLIRSTIIALNQANQTGNYTVLRDLAAPNFRNANDASRLGAIFQVLRDQGIDLTPLLQISPEVTVAPAFDVAGRLRLAGAFPTHPLRVNFDLSFEFVERHWKPYAISVYFSQVDQQVQAPGLSRPLQPTAKSPPVTNSQAILKR